MAFLDHMEDNYRKIGIGGFKHIVDVGACIGTWSIAHRLMYPEARITAFEPTYMNWGLCRRNTATLDIKCWPIGLHSHLLPRQMFYLSEDNGDTGLYSLYGKIGLPQLVDLDALDNARQPPIDLLKIDVEGNEINVLKGGEQTIRRDKPVLIVEGTEKQQAMAGHTANDVAETVISMGYRLAATIEGDGIFLPL